MRRELDRLKDKSTAASLSLDRDEFPTSANVSKWSNGLVGNVRNRQSENRSASP